MFFNIFSNKSSHIVNFFFQLVSLSVRALAFWISRPISMTYAFLSWAYDIPEEYHGTWKGKLCFCMFLAVAGINFGWMLVMIAPQRLRDSAIRMVNGTSTVKMD